MKSWIKALERYCYPVRLNCYESSDLFPNHFNTEIAGNRISTIGFENYFRENAQRSIEVYFEVVFWKLYSQKNARQRGTSRIVEHMLGNNVEPRLLYEAIRQFVEVSLKQNLQNIRNLLGIRTNVLAVALTFPAFLKPEKYPMVDNNIARWVNDHYAEHNRSKYARLTPFSLGYTSLRDNDFSNYTNWVGWCNEIAQILSEKTDICWRPRDVEMAVFTAKRENIELNVL